MKENQNNIKLDSLIKKTLEQKPPSNFYPANLSIEQLQAEVNWMLQHLATHPIYQYLNSLEAIECFMKYHVFAVFDFMSLLKSLQNQITCTIINELHKSDGKINITTIEKEASVVLGAKAGLVLERAIAVISKLVQ
ncbi:MAG: DUF3050 domain-containing protein [Prochloraceae cyanobacterium]|nr:DUF3050 domain-containing protein [Prochloraceae cyanobacterium]